MIATGTGRWILLPMAASAILTFTSEVPHHYWLALGFTILTFVLVLFFRDPERPIGEGIISPADGRVVEADPTQGHLAIFMNLLHVHVNRVPLEGTVQALSSRHGPHKPAFLPEARDNAQVETLLLTSIGEVKVRQIAGIFARRVRTYVNKGERVDKGQRLGIICFGSRVELDLPADRVVLKVRVGDRVRAGSSQIGEVRA